MREIVTSLRENLCLKIKSSRLYKMYFSSNRVINNSQPVPNLSVRAASWVGAQCVRFFCCKRAIYDSRIEDFCKYLEELAVADDVPGWDNRSRDLEVTGLDDLPVELKTIESLEELLEAVHEISASQIYGAWLPDQVSNYLIVAIRLSGFDFQQSVNIEALCQHEPKNDGWGVPVDKDTVRQWREV